MGAFLEAVGSLRPVDNRLLEAARQWHLKLTKPAGSLGVLEEIGARMCAMAARVPPPLAEPAAVAVFAADHGVLSQGGSPWPAEVTAQMVANFLGGGAAINVIAKAAGADLTVVDIGIASDPGRGENLVSKKVRRGTADITQGDAMTPDEAMAALDAGAEVAAELLARGARCLVCGDMGIGNTTPSAALVAAFSGQQPEAVTGRGTGIDDDMWAVKVEAVRRAVARHGWQGPSGAEAAAADPLAVLAAVGGLEHAGIAGFAMAGAAGGVPVLLDGLISSSAALVAAAVAPAVTGYLLAGHRSVEPGASIALSMLGLDPILDLGMRLGEGSGACLALPVVQVAARIMSEMATFDSAGIKG